MIQEIQRIERSVKERMFSDKELINFWLNFFILNWLTGGVMGLVIYFQKIIRIDKFFLRKRDYYASLITYTEKNAQENGRYEEVSGDITNLQNFYANNFVAKISELGPAKSFFLTILTLGIWGIVVSYKINKAWDEFQMFEQQFDEQLSAIWIKLGLMNYPLNFKTDENLKRNFWIQILLSIITFGIWGIVWQYKTHTDPENIYKEFHAVEDTVLQTIKK